MLLYPGKIVHKARDEHGEIVVVDDQDVRSLYFDNYYKQSSLSRTHPARLVLRYTQAMMAALLFIDTPGRALVVGLGGGSLVRFLVHYFPGLRVDVVELREAVVKVAHEHFFLPKNVTQLEVHIADGRDFLFHAPRIYANYDLIFFDAYDEHGPADSMRGRDLYAAAHERMSDRAVLALNLWNRRRDNFPSAWAQLNADFDHRAVQLPLEKVNGNIVALASTRPLPPLQHAELKRKARFYADQYDLDFPGLLQQFRRNNGSLLQRLFC